jgi:hypothetical protein
VETSAVFKKIVTTDKITHDYYSKNIGGAVFE